MHETRPQLPASGQPPFVAGLPATDKPQCGKKPSAGPGAFTSRFREEVFRIAGD